MNETNYVEQLANKAFAELALIVNGTKPYLKPADWKPVPYAATAPASGVTLDGGPFRTCFERNIEYLNDWFCRTQGGTQPADPKNWWETALPGSSEGRMLAAAANTLRWGERADMRKVVDAIVAIVKVRQRADGYCLPFDESEMSGNPDPGRDERRNYDRAHLTRGMVAAAQAGNPDALPVMRRFYDWFYASPYSSQVLAGPFDATSPKLNNVQGKPGRGTSHNCNNGHDGSLVMYFSPLGKPDDLVQAERYFIQDWFIEASRNREPLSLSHYPYHVAHCYVLLAYKAWLDHYRATGHPKYLEGARGAWDIVHDHFLHVGGSLAICEAACGKYPPGSYFLHEKQHTGENCGSVFWIEINHRLLQLFPQEAKYADEIERSLLNCTLHTQDHRGHFSYHCRMEGQREPAGSTNTCCEVFGSALIASLPQYIFSVAPDGVYVNLFAPATLAGKLRMTTDFPFSGNVQIAVEKPLTLRIRIPGWAGREIPVNVNGKVVVTGKPGTYVTLECAAGNVTFELPLALHTVRYTGADQHPDRSRHALLYGPVLMALTSTTALDIPAGELISRLEPVVGKPLHFTVRGVSGAVFLPYWQLTDGVTFTCFPVMGTAHQ